MLEVLALILKNVILLEAYWKLQYEIEIKMSSDDIVFENRIHSLKIFQNFVILLANFDLLSIKQLRYLCVMALS